ncbi:cytochrome c biogenesis protein CcsA [Sulfurovum sp. XTW-4]|uniref:Cytochrome c biogenesis protein CcsA n=1 Tax=Sulfurovum xiamenensis TaxID=3019066 RepID=A0ABT7QTT0_9BACT|nr:cytochrome c biogenesis protein CcsA [Sulfurovum xiamenensis]MDM5264431.1 cytochrome c biogenesis protein CcsA [Sulfurovum xiamenensis]
MKYIFSMKMAVFMLFAFGALIGTATFIENDYGTQTARALIYKTQWFEVFLGYFIALLTYNMIKYKSYKTKPAVFLFHFSFLVIALGAVVTRYIGYEGIMHIREGESSHTMVSDAKVLQIHATEGQKSATLEKELYFSTMTGNMLTESLIVGDKKVKVELLKYMPTAQEKAIPSENGKKLLELKISTGKKGEIYYIAKGERKDFGGFYLGYDIEPTTDKPTFLIKEDGTGYKVEFPFVLQTLNMNDRSSGELKAGENEFKNRMLYRFGSNAIVLKDVHEKAIVKLESHDLKTQKGQAEYIQWKVSVGDESKIITTRPYQGQMGKIKQMDLNGVHIDMRVGAKLIDLPFSIKLENFELERYPGSMTPASYSSDVVLIDKEQNINMPYKIYMNHVLDHRNYRFFQSSYDQDEKGTVLSVNHDPGTLPTYIGYILLTIGMIWSLFAPSGRFQKLLKGARKLQTSAAAVAFVALLALNPQHLNAAAPTIDDEMLKTMRSYDADHAKNFGKIAVQDHQGRMKPMDTVAHDVIAKITGRSLLFDLEPTQMLLGMIMQPDLYQNVPMIKVGHKKIAVTLGLPENTKYARFTDFFSEGDNSYKIFSAVTEASQKKPLEKSQYDKELIKIDERVNVAFMAYQGSLLRIFPKPNDANNKWMAPLDAIKAFSKEQADAVRMSIAAYFQMVAQGLKTGDWSRADLALTGIRQYQEKYGSAVIPSKTHIDMEIKYNKFGLFGKLVPLYLLLGIVLLIFAFINVLKPAFSMKWIMRIALAVLIVGFALHIVGLGIRWYISGHAPWSNAYESIVFIAASTVLAGIILARRSPFALAGTAILAGVTMGVAHMNFINPEITNLVPVLKSYWLMIHVATIISGDGFFGLGSILSLLVLILYIMRGKNGNENIDRSIKELTNLSEMGLIIGLFLLTVGNFLGGVWANESWGRYWGWDPKETWAAVTILIYATVLHLRFIPALKSNFIYNVTATWAYSTVLMTYFGVNYYLSGLHSYAAGDPVPIPMWVYYAVAGLFVLTVLAARNRKLS